MRRTDIAGIFCLLFFLLLLSHVSRGEAPGKSAYKLKAKELFDDKERELKELRRFVVNDILSNDLLGEEEKKKLLQEANKKQDKILKKYADEDLMLKKEHLKDERKNYCGLLLERS